jgi:DNA-binding NarL/FixJ family response regulator
MDLTIPGGMGGKEAVLEILKIDPEAKVVVASGYSNDPIMAGYRDYGFCAAMVKPFKLQEFQAIISKVLS